MNFALRKKPLTMKKRVLFFVKFLVNSQFARSKISANKSMRASDNEKGINKLQPNRAVTTKIQNMKATINKDGKKLFFYTAVY